MSVSPVDPATLAEAEAEAGTGGDRPGPGFVGRSPGQLAWARLRRDRTGLVSGGMLVFFVLVALAVPAIEWAYGTGPGSSSSPGWTGSECRSAMPAG